jgi:hypothetical protein
MTIQNYSSKYKKMLQMANIIIFKKTKNLIKSLSPKYILKKNNLTKHIINFMIVKYINKIKNVTLQYNY